MLTVQSAAQAVKAIITTLGNLANAAGVLTNDGSGNLSWVAASGGSVLLATLTPSGSPTTLTTGNFVSTGYTYLLVIFDKLVSSSGAPTVNISSDNASTFDTALSSGGALTTNGAAYVYRPGVTADKIYIGVTGTANVIGTFSTKTSPTTNVRLANGPFTGGNVFVYGVP